MTIAALDPFADLERASARGPGGLCGGTGAHTPAAERARRSAARLTCAHVGGSKGKGSVCALVAAAAEAAGLRTGAYTQPHLHSFRERVARRPAHRPARLRRPLSTDSAASEALTAAHSEDGPYSTFELATVLALLWFAERQVDLAVIEVGLGGRLDATRVIDPAVVGLTTIVLEHTRVLGDSLAAIAHEKAGIIKPGVPVVAAAQSEEALSVFRAACRRARR